jgi:drug/metabolite transporter (DMT)-like permease
VWLLHHVPLGTAATYAYVNPVVAIALGMLFLDERITWRIALGAAIVLASVAVVVRRETEAAVEPFSE